MSNTEDFFPFTVRGSSYYNTRHGGGVTKFVKTFLCEKPLTIKKKETIGSFVSEYVYPFSWYCFDVIIHSKTEIEFVAYDIADSVYGSRGREIHRFKAVVDGQLTGEYIDNRLIERAKERREKEWLNLEKKICDAYANEERKALGL